MSKTDDELVREIRTCEAKVDAVNQSLRPLHDRLKAAIAAAREAGLHVDEFLGEDGRRRIWREHEL